MDRAILLIEDNRLHARLYSTILRAEGFHPIAIADPRRALDWAVANRIVASLIDIRLPHVDGREVIRRLREDGRVRSAPIIAVSAVPVHDMEESCLAAGADRFRAKPVALHLLLEDVRELVGAC